MKKIILLCLSLVVATGCTKKEDLDMKLAGTYGSTTEHSLIIKKGEGAFITGQSNTNIVVNALALNKSFEVTEAESGIKFDFNYQKETNSWVCATCASYERPIHWTKVN